MGGGWIPAYAGKTEVGQGSVMRNEIPRGPRNDGRVSCKKGDSGRQGSRGGRMGSSLRLHEGRLFAGKRVSGRGSVLGDEIPRLRFAALRMTCGGEEVGWVPAPRLHGGRISTRGQREGRGSGRFANSPYELSVSRVGGMGPRPPSSRGQDLDARTTGGAGRAVREPPLPDGCQTGGRDGFPLPPVFTGAGSSREKRVGGRGSVLGGEIPRLRFAALRMTCGGRKWDGSPPPVFTGAGSRREDNGGVGLGLEVGDDGFEGLYGLVYVRVGVGEGGVELLGALEDSLLLDEVAESGLNCVVGG